MTQSKNETQAQAPTLGTLLATALGIAYGAWAVIVWGSGFSEEHLPPESRGQSPKLPGGMGQQSSLPEMAPEPPNSQVASQ